MQEVDSLAKMANQIADNFSFHDDAVERTAEHLQKFWAPSMQRSLQLAVAENTVDLKPTARAALDLLPAVD